MNEPTLPERGTRRRISRRSLLGTGLRAGVGAAGLGLLGVGGTRAPAASEAAGAPRAAARRTAFRAVPATATPIQHFIVLMQENHTFDNYFGTYPGADGIPLDVQMPIDPDDPQGDYVEPFFLGDSVVEGLLYTTQAFDDVYRRGAMNGFAAAGPGRRASDVALGYYDRRILPFYWNVAEEFVLFDRLFSSFRRGSVANHMYWVAGVAGVAGGEDRVASAGVQDVETIFDRLDAKELSWKFYVQNYDPAITYRTILEYRPNRAAQVKWVPLLQMDRFIDDPRLARHIVPLDEYFDDLANDQLPAVSYIVPSGASEHPPGSIQAGQRFVRSLITALMRSAAWDRSAFSWAYDDWGGFYDHVSPPQVDDFGYGFRVPALLVSPYARRGFIDNTTLDFTSYLKFIETNWGLDPLAERDASANDLTSAFDFSQPPRPPVLLTSEVARPEKEDTNSGVIYGLYGVSAGVAALTALGIAASRYAGSARGWRK